MVHNPLQCFPLHSRLLRQQYISTPNCFKRTILPPPVWYPSIDWRICPLPFWSRWRWSVCSKCNTSNSLSFSADPIASSFTAETFALKQGLAWCTSHLMTCKFQSVLFLTDSQSALCILSSAPSYLLPESLWYVWSLASSFSNNTSLSFQWVPGHAGLPRNEKADLLAKTGASLPTDAIPSPFPHLVPKSVIANTAIGDVTSHTPIWTSKSPKSLWRLLLSRSIRSELSRLRCHGHSLLLSSYLHRISRKENSDCSACGHPL